MVKKRNQHSRNYGLGNRDIVRAGYNALRESECGYVTQAVNGSRWRQFCVYLKTNFSISDMRCIQLDHVKSYAAHLKLRHDNGHISPSTAQDYLAVVNRILEIARGDRNLRVAGVSDAGLDRRTYVAVQSKANTEGSHDFLCQRISPHLSAVVKLQRAFGLRLEESLKINPSKALAEALRLGHIHVVNGTKGGRARTVPVTSNIQVKALKNSIQFQSTQRSLIPDGMTYVEFKRRCYRELQSFEGTFHGERHAYANARYLQLTGVGSPVDSGTSRRAHIETIVTTLRVSGAAAKTLDLDARLTIAEELGHSRSGITNCYLGK